MASMTPTFLIPSIVWCGLTPSSKGVSRKPGVPDLQSDAWGGQLRSDDYLKHVLETLDPALILLNLAGYQIQEVVIGVPDDVLETDERDLISITMATMEVGRGPTHVWTPLGTPSAQVALWVEPRFAGARPAYASGPTLDLVALVEPMRDALLELDFAIVGAGWLKITWPAGQTDPALIDQLGSQVGLLIDALITELALQHEDAMATAAANDGAVTCGLLSAFDSRGWSVVIPAQETSDGLPPGVAVFGSRLRELVFGEDGIGLAELLRSDTAQPPIVALDRWADDPHSEDARLLIEDLSICADELADQALRGAIEDEDQAQAFAESAYSRLVELPVTQLLLHWQALGVLDFLASVEVAPDCYGGYALQRGDDDATKVYGGLSRPVAETDQLPAPGEAGYVAQLRRDLAELGFGPMFQYTTGEPDQQTFDVWLERAVREFQIYAKMPNLAQETTETGHFAFYGDRLAQVPNPERYSGLITGVVNAKSRALITSWLANRLRCPVVIETRSRTGGFAEPFVDPNFSHTDNVWQAQQVRPPVTANGPRFFARDFTGYWTLSEASIENKRRLDRIELGRWSNLFAPNGPASIPPREVWSETEITPESVAGPFTSLSAAGRNTFRVIRAVAEVECLGYFDVYNAADWGFFSMGPCHWTIALRERYQRNPLKYRTIDAELPPYLAYLKGLGGAELVAFESTFGGFGCGITKDWPLGTSGATSPSWEPDHRKYTAWVTLETEGDALVEAPRDDNETAEWFRQWHWCFRFVMAARTVEAFRKRMWDYARLRLRDFLSTPWEPQLLMQDGATTRPATIGDIFSSERSVALLLRWHVNRPADLLPLSNASSKLRLAFDAAGAAEWGNPSQWTNANEASLCEELFNLRPAYNDVLHCTLDVIYHWPDRATGASCQNSGAERGDRALWGWKLPVHDLLNLPLIVGVENDRTDTNVPYNHTFTVDWRDAIAAPVLTASAGDAAAIVSGAITISPAPTVSVTRYTINVPLVRDATGTITVILTADNGAHVTKVAFYLTVGGATRTDPPSTPAGSTTGLSMRRKSFTLNEVGLPPDPWKLP